MPLGMVLIVPYGNLIFPVFKLCYHVMVITFTIYFIFVFYVVIRPSSLHCVMF